MTSELIVKPGTGILSTDTTVGADGKLTHPAD